MPTHNFLAELMKVLYRRGLNQDHCLRIFHCIDQVLPKLQNFFLSSGTKALKNKVPKHHLLLFSRQLCVLFLPLHDISNFLNNYRDNSVQGDTTTTEKISLHITRNITCQGRGHANDEIRQNTGDFVLHTLEHCYDHQVCNNSLEVA